MPVDPWAAFEEVQSAPSPASDPWAAFEPVEADPLNPPLRPLLAGAQGIGATPWYRRGILSEGIPGVLGPGAVEGPSVQDALDALPSVGGAVGGALGAGSGAFAGLGLGAAPGAVGGAAIGGQAGEAARQLGRRAVGAYAPRTSGEAATEIGQQGGIQGGAQAVGAGLGRFLSSGSQRLMQSALKPTATTLKEYGTTAPKLVKTLLDEGVNVTPSGLSKLNKLLDATNAEIKEAVRNAPGRIPMARVAAQTATTAKKLANQVNPNADLKAVADTVDEFMNHPVYQGSLSVPEAQAMKIGTYQQIGKKYGQVSSATIETQKTLARGLKEEIAHEVPQIAGLNARDSRLMAATDAVGRRVALAGNRDPVGFAWVTQNPTTFLAALMDRSPAVKSMLARGMYQSAGTAARVSPDLIRAAVYSISTFEPAAEPPRE